MDSYLPNHRLLVVEETEKIHVGWRYKNPTNTIMVMTVNGMEFVSTIRVPFGVLGMRFHKPKSGSVMTFELIDEFGRMSEVEQITVK